MKFATPYAKPFVESFFIIDRKQNWNILISPSYKAEAIGCLKKMLCGLCDTFEFEAGKKIIGAISASNVKK